MKSIPLTQGQFALVDDGDFENLNQWRWQAVWDKHTKSYYAVRTDYSGFLGFRRKQTIRMHRQIMNTPEDMDCDHWNHDTLDNQRRNLRNVTNSQNLMNRRGANVNSKLDVLGVSKHGKGFRAHIQVGKKTKFFPVRYTIEEAIVDRKQAEKEQY
jgi:hypothetical protein